MELTDGLKLKGTSGREGLSIFRMKLRAGLLQPGLIPPGDFTAVFAFPAKVLSQVVASTSITSRRMKPLFCWAAYCKPGLGMFKIKREFDISKFAKTWPWPFLSAIFIGLPAFVLLPVAWYLLFAFFEPYTSFLLYALGAGVCFGLAIYQVRAESRNYRREPISNATTFKAVSWGVGSGLAFLVSGAVLGAAYVQVESHAGEFSLRAFGVRVLIGATLSAAVGTTFYVPLAAKYVFTNMGNMFLQEGGFFFYIMGPLAGALGAIFGALDSTQAAPWWFRLLAAAGVGVGGAVLGLITGYRFTILFTLLYNGDRDDTVVVPVAEAEFQALFLSKNGQYRMQIHPTYRIHPKYLAAYRVAEGAITHIARVKSVKFCESPHQYRITIHSPATAIEPIRLAPEGKVKSVRGSRFTSRALLLQARNLDEVFEF